MKIAITSSDSSLDALVSEKLGRCSYFIIFDSETKNTSSIANTAKNLEHGAGPKAAQLIIRENAEVVLTGAVGNNAEETLKKGGVKIITGLKSNMKVSEVIDLYLNSKLS
jgi:predicted Fe-Mo cluster-binding NifX family protein